MKVTFKPLSLNLLIAVLLLMGLAEKGHADIVLPKGITHYVALEQRSLVTDQIIANGSSRVGPIIQSVLDAFIGIYPHVDYKVEQNGSGAAIDALLDGKANIGLMSRRIKPSEVDAFMARRGYPPTELRIASDALRVIVNRHNPTNQISLVELEAVFSEKRACGGPHTINTWEYFEWFPDPNHSSSTIRQHVSAKGTGVHDFFKKLVLCDGEYKKQSIESAHTAEEVIEEVALSRSSIGFAPLGEPAFGVKDLLISKANLYPGYKPITKHIMDGRYPLSRYLFVYLDKPPASAMPLLFREFFKFLFSDQGQQIIINHYAIPLSHKLIRDGLTTLIKE